MIATVRRRLRSVAKDGLAHVAARRPERVDLSFDHWDLSIGPSGALHSGSVDLAELASDHGTPLHVVRGDHLDRNAANALSAVGSGCDVFYSYKTNPVPGVLARLHARGVGAEVISAYEYWLARQLGVPPQRIIYNGPVKSPESVRTAIRDECLLLNANSASEADAISRVAAEEQKVVRLGVRVALPSTWAGQFGVDATSSLLDDLVRDLATRPAVDLVGLHIHRGVTIRTEDELAGYIAEVLDLCDRLRHRTGWAPRVLDVGGSVACRTVAPFPNWEFRLNRAYGSDLLAPDPSDTIDLGMAARTVAALVDEHFRTVGSEPPRVVLEPGRALTGDTQLLLTSVHDVKDDLTPRHALLDAGINIAEAVRGEYHQLFSVTAPSAEPTTSYRLAGPICTPADVLYNNWRLPELEPGHLLAIMDSGAYLVPFSTSFSFPRPPVVMIDGDDVIVCRERETFDDLVRHDVVLQRPPVT